MRARLEALLENLRVLKNEGVKDVFVSDEALAALRERVAAADAEKGKGVAPPVPARAAPAPKATAPAREEKTVPAAGAFPPPVSSFPREAPPAPPPSTPEEKKPAFDAAISAARAAAVPAVGTSAERLDALRGQMLGDPVCNAHLRKGKHLVFGEGNPDADVFFCGEAPGAEEETEGRPFVGPAGQLLTKMIAAAGLTREQVYIGNIMKWRPELPTLYGNRPPTPEEMSYCLPYLAAQLEIVRPRVIVALGLTAVNGLLGFDPDRRIGAMRGRRLEFRGIAVVATYHPSYLLRNASVRSKRAAWEDFLAMMEIAGLPVSERQRGYFLPRR